MSLTPSNVYINWTACGFTPSGGSLAPINKVTSLKPSRGGSMEGFKGDLNLFFQVIAIPSQTRTIEVTTGDVKAALNIAVGERGAFTATLADAVNGIATGGGGFTLALPTCVCTGNTAQGDHSKFGEATLTFEGYDSTGTATELFTITAL